MAELTAARNNALPYPVYGVPWVATFPLLDADGDPISPSSPDSEVSKNCDTYADCTNEATEIATSSGTCYLILTGTEMTADIVMVRIQSTGAKTTILNLAPRKLVPLRAGTSAGGATGSITLDSGANATDDFYNGCLCVAVIDSNTEARIIDDYTGSSKVASVTPDWNVAPDADDTFTIYLPEGIQVNQANATHWLGSTLAAVTVNGVPEVDITHFNGTAGTFASGRPEVNVSHWLGTAAATPTVAGVPEVDVTHFGGTAGSFASGRAEVNTSHWRGSAVAVPTTAGVPEVDVTHWLGTAAASPDTAGYPVVTIKDGTGAGEINTDSGAVANVVSVASVSNPVNIRSLASGTATGGSTTTLVDSSRTEADTDYWKGCLVVFTSGNVLGQVRLITAFTPGSDTITFTPATTQAISNQNYEILPAGPTDLRLWAGSAPSALISGRVDANAQAVGTAAIAAASFAADARMIAAGKPGSVNDASPAAGNFDGDAGLSGTDDFYNGSVLAFTSGTLLGLARQITDYTGSSKNLVFATAFPAAPADTDTFVILGRIE